MIKIKVNTKKTGNILEPEIMTELDNIANVESYGVEYDVDKLKCTITIDVGDKKALKDYLKAKNIDIIAEV